jgi:hypothetical protein
MMYVDMMDLLVIVVQSLWVVVGMIATPALFASIMTRLTG